MEFIIDRSKWVAGCGDFRIGEGMTYMKNVQGFMCCLGQCLQQKGVPEEALMDVSTPGRVNFDLCRDDLQPKIGEHVQDAMKIFVKNENLGMNSEISREAMEINDGSTLTSEQREERLKKLFENHGHKISFVGEAVQQDPE